jgi:hypothetical protein
MTFWDGVAPLEVPGTKAKIPGLIFADDLTGMAGTIRAMDACLSKLSEWADEWRMLVGHKKPLSVGC